MLAGRWAIRGIAVLGAFLYLRIMLQHAPVSHGEALVAGGLGILMAIMIFLMTVEAR
jgi:hypothetical protein